MTVNPQITSLSANALDIGYQQRNRPIRVARISELTIKTGDFICLLGPNGAGKSTLIRTLAGIQKPLQGIIQLNDQHLDRFSPQERARKISVVLTERMPLGLLDGYSLVALGRHPYSGRFGFPREADRKRIAWAFQKSGAVGLENRQVVQLSDGERQKLLIARSLAQETPLILLDEPTAFLDLTRQIELMNTLRKLAHQEQMGILLSTHNLDLALRFADRIWLFEKNGTITDGYPEELALNGAISSTFSSSEVSWESRHGGFRIQINSDLKAVVQGEGIHALWTQHALERLGFTITDNITSESLQVCVTETEPQPAWSVDYMGKTKNVDSISAFVDWILRQNTS